MSGLKSRRKGYRGEKELHELLLAHGINVKKTNASGSGTHDQGDFYLFHNGKEYTLEGKREKKLPIVGLENRLDQADILIMRQDQGEWKVYLDLETLLKLLDYSKK